MKIAIQIQSLKMDEFVCWFVSVDQFFSINNRVRAIEDEQKERNDEAVKRQRVGSREI